ncbi:MAG: hypothetical protein ACJ8F7_14775 [Gemmataceae bacterium]
MHEHIWLMARTASPVQLNGKCLEAGVSEWDLTDLLLPRNELAITASAGDPDSAPFGDVALEIRMAAWLADAAVSLDADRRLHIRGTVRGQAERPMDLYAILGRFTIAHGTVAAGETFDITSDPLPPERLQLDERFGLELVNGAIAWHCVELPLPENLP